MSRRKIEYSEIKRFLEYGNMIGSEIKIPYMPIYKIFVVLEPLYIKCEGGHIFIDGHIHPIDSYSIRKVCNILNKCVLRYIGDALNNLGMEDYDLRNWPSKEMKTAFNAEVKRLMEADR